MKKYIFYLNILVFILLFATTKIEAVEVSAFEHTYFRSSGAPATETNTFYKINGFAKIRVINGSLADADYEMVSSSIIVLNGEVIIDSSNFNQNVGLIEVEKILSGDINTIEVTLKGKPGGALTVQVLAAAGDIDFDDDGFTGNEGDCNDDDNEINPDAQEVCDGEDNNCNGQIDEGVTTTFYHDADNDGYGNPNDTTEACQQPTGYVTDNTDCNDNDANEHPGQTWYKDADNDGYSDGTTDTVSCVRPTGHKTVTELTSTSGDCEDSDATVNPGTTEIPYNGKDDDCNASTPDDDLDGDGFVNADDCDDSNAAINPAAVEIPNNGIDEDCDGADLLVLTLSDKNVIIGDTLVLNLAAALFNNNLLTFSVSPLPLPDNATFNTTTGIFTFSPAGSQIGIVTLTFTASNGSVSDSKTINITVSGAVPGGVTALKGQILDANDASQGSITPIVGATVTHMETGLFTTTDNSGNFNLTGLDGGIQHVEYNGSAITAPDGSFYGAFRGSENLIANVTNTIVRPIYLMRIDSAGQVQVNPASTTVVDNPNLGITLTIPPNTLKDEFGNDYTGMLSISEVPAGFTPASLPDNLGPGMIISIQPMGLTFAQPVPIIFPNFDNLPPGTQINIWSLDHTLGEFFIAGIGQVSADGSVIDTIQGGIVQASWHFPLPAAPTVLANPEDDPDRNETSDNLPLACRVETNSGFVIQTGNFYEDHTLPSYRSLGVPRGLKFVYNSTSAYPSPIITTQTSLPGNTPVPDAISTSLKIGSVNQANDTFKQGTAGLVRQSSVLDATSMATGVYTYSLETRSHYPLSTISSSQRGNVIINNQINSPFGAGWTLDGLQKLTDLDRVDGRVLLMEGDGSARRGASAKATGTGSFTATTRIPVGKWAFSIAKGDFNGDSVLDLVTANRIGNSITILIGDGAGDFSLSQTIHIGNTPKSVLSGDLDGDSVLDLVVATNAGVSILIGNGSGGFSSPTGMPVSGSPSSIAAGDFNGDNVLDFAVATDANVSILIGNGSGGFFSPSSFPVAGGGINRVIATGDLNGDNVLDLAVSTNDNVSVLLGDGTGSFSSPTEFTVGRVFFSMTIDDFNGDNALDLATADFLDDSISILLGDGIGSFAPPVSFPVDDRPFPIVTGDFDEDGALDLAVGNTGSVGGNTLSILFGDGTGDFSSSTTIPLFSLSPWSIVIDDFNGDSVLDLATGTVRGGFDNFGDVSILLGDSSTQARTPGDFSTLLKNDDGTFTRTMKDGTQINFDVNGFHTSTKDRNGNTTSYAYDPDGLLTSITDPVGLVTNLNYQNSLIASVTDPASRTTTFLHDSNGNLISIIDPDGSVSSYSYDLQHLLIAETDANSNTHTINYSFAGRFESMDFADGSTRQGSPSVQNGLVDIAGGIGDSVLNPAPNVLAGDIVSTLTDQNGHVSTTKTDNFGGITESTDNCCLGRITTIIRDADGLPIQITRANGAVSTNTYDSSGNLLTSTDQSIGATTTFTYDPTFNQVTSITDPKGNTTTINYDANGNPIKVIDAHGSITIQTYNQQGQLISVTDALGNTTTFTHDVIGNLNTFTDPSGSVTALTNDAAGNVITATDANGNITQFVYDLLNRLIQVTDANNNDSIYNYDANGNLTQVTDANGNSTTFAYDSQDRLAINTDPLGNADTFGYDGNGNLITTTDRNSQIIGFEYDGLNQLIKKTLPGNLVTTFDYDLVGNLTDVTDPDSNLAFTYDGADRLTSVATTNSPNQPDITINYTYDANGNRTTMSDTPTGTTNYVYDALNRITSITNPASQAVGFNYDAISRRTMTTLPNGVTTDFAYDTNNRLTSLQHKLGVATFSSFGYSYDNVGNRTAMNTVRTGVSVNSSLNYTYDNIYRLTQATRQLPSQPDETFNFDPLGNRLRRDGETTDSTIGVANRLIDDKNFLYTNDNNGNLIRKTDKTTNATTDYTYDTENQLIRIYLPGGSVAQYRYDGFGRRIEKDVDGAVSRYVYDNEDILFEFDGSNTQTARYTHGPGIDEPLIMERGGQSLFYQADGLGSITDLTDTNGAVAQSYIYDSFGNIDQQVGTLLNPYTYTGREFDPESGLYYYRARYYDAGIGRFLTEDPIGFAGGDVNLYGYVQNNPVNFVDPDGLLVLYYGGGGAVGAGYKVNPGDQDSLTFFSGTVTEFYGSNRGGGISNGNAFTGGAGRIVGAAAGGGALVGINFGDVEDLSGCGSSAGLLVGPFSFELTLDGDGQSITGFSFGFLNKGIGLGLFGQETRTGTISN